jgi:hypothetical protein
VNIQWTFSEHSVNIQWTFSEHSVNIQWTFSEHSVNIQWTFSEHSVNIQWKTTSPVSSSRMQNRAASLNTFSEHSVNVQWTHTRQPRPCRPPACENSGYSHSANLCTFIYFLLELPLSGRFTSLRAWIQSTPYDTIGKTWPPPSATCPAYSWFLRWLCRSFVRKTYIGLI